LIIFGFGLEGLENVAYANIAINRTMHTIETVIAVNRDQSTIDESANGTGEG
jgi:hypothetical protein